MIGVVLDQVFRRESGKVLAGLIRALGDFELAEEALQESFARAAEVWPREGLPDKPAAWLTTVARRCGLDLLRRRRTSPLVSASEGPPDQATPAEEPDASAEEALRSGVVDDRLRLLFTCCHPSLAPAAQASLALRTLGGLSTREIARAFVEPESTCAQRLVRAKRKILEARIPYRVPDRAALPERFTVVLSVVYLIFNEGYSATEHDSLVRVDLCAEAIRIARLLVELLPEEPEGRGLLALLLLQHARRDARVGPAGELVPLEEQDRARWDHALIAEGTSLVQAALAEQKLGPYQVQAAIAALHDGAAGPAQTDWPQINELYRVLLRFLPTPIVELNAAVALAMARGPEQGLAWIDTLAAREELAAYHLLHAARADLLRRAGRFAEALAAYERALGLVRNPAERAFLERRLREVRELSASARP